MTLAEAGVAGAVARVDALQSNQLHPLDGTLHGLVVAVSLPPHLSVLTLQARAVVDNSLAVQAAAHLALHVHQVILLRIRGRRVSGGARRGGAGAHL